MRYAFVLLLVQLCTAITSHAQQAIPLDGDWLISPLLTADKPFDLQAQKQSGNQRVNLDTSNWRTIPLPRTSGWSGWDKSVTPEKAGKSYWAGQQKNTIHNAVWYRRNFKAPPLSTNERLILHFDAIGWESAIFVNGKHMLDHRGSFTPIDVDITDALQADGDNLIAVCALSDYGARPVRHVYGKMFFAEQNMAGIIGQVTLLVVNETRIDQTRITPRIDTDSIEVQYEITHAASTIKDVRLTVEVREHNQADATPLATKNLGKIQLKTGSTTHDVHLKLPGVKRWTPASPVLYDLVFSLSHAGKIISTSTHRFGMRQFIAKGNRFYLNDQHVRLYIGNTLTYGMFKFAQDGENDRFKDWLLRQKKLGVNTIRYHMAGIDSYRMLDVCDEVGMLVIDEWAWFHRVEYGLTKSDQLAEFHANNDAEMKQWVKRDYNHPSCVIWSLANEVWTKNEVPMLDHTYAQLRRLDPSGRPMTNSSGFHSVIRDQKGLTDIYDFHNYAMHSRYAWPVVHESVDADMQVLRDQYGTIDKPVIITESLAIWQPAQVKLKVITPALYVEHKDTRYVREIGLANLANRNDAYNLITGLWSIDVLEAFRQETLIQGFGPWFDNRFRLPATIARVYGPNYVGFDVKNRPNAHHYAGKSWQADLVVVHDAMTAMNARVQLQVRSDTQASKPVVTLNKPVTFADGDEKQMLGMQWDVPPDLPAGDYVVELQLLDVLDHVMAHNNMLLKIAAPLQVAAMHDAARVGVFAVDALSDFGVLDGLKRLAVPYAKVRDAQSLRDVDVLILPENWGKNITRLPETLDSWIKQGGRLLAMAPGVNVPLSWLPGMEVMVGSNMRQPFVDCVQPAHRVLDGLTAADFVDGFNGPDRMTVRSMINPLTVNAILAAGSYSSDGQLAVLREARIGNGAAMEATIDFTQRFGNDPVATRLLLNMLSYVISGQILQYAPMLDATPLHPIRAALAGVTLKDWQAIALFDVANAPLKNTLGQGSTLDYQHLPLGKQVMGLVPFTLATTPTQQAHAIIAMQGHRMPQLPARVDGIVVGQKVQRLAFLQAAYYAAPGRIATYVVHYDDGSSVSIPVIGGEHVGDWYSPRDLPGAIVAWEKPHPLITHATVGAYLMLWDNPKPDAKITTLDIISQGTEQQVGSTLMLLGLSAQQVGK